MKPKDLLQHLEKGDRTMHHLTEKPERESADVTLNGLFRQVYSQPLGQWIGTAGTGASSFTQAAQSAGLVAGSQISTAQELLQGGTIRW